MKGRPTDYSSVVRAHWKEATAYLLASRQPCIKIRDDEVGNIGGNRKLVAISADDLPNIDRKGIWVLGVILCPGDSTQDIARWAKKQRIPGGKVAFFLHPTTDKEVLRPWVDAGYRADPVDVVDDWGDLHAAFGLFLNDAIYEARGPP